MNMAVVAEQTTRSFDCKLSVSYIEVEFIETSLKAYPWIDYYIYA